MHPHPVDPLALVAGLLFALSGTAIIAERQWHDLDITAFAAAGIAIVGLLLAATIVARLIRDTIAANTAPDHVPGVGTTPVDEEE